MSAFTGLLNVRCYDELGERRLSEQQLNQHWPAKTNSLEEGDPSIQRRQPRLLGSALNLCLLCVTLARAGYE